MIHEEKKKTKMVIDIQVDFSLDKNQDPIVQIDAFLYQCYHISLKFICCIHKVYPI